MLKRSQLIVKKYEGFGGNFIDSQYLAASYETGKPHMIQRPLQMIFSAKNDIFERKPLMAMMYKLGGTKEIDTEIFGWNLQGADTKFARIVEVLDPTNLTPGINNTTFRIKLDVDFYASPEVLLGATADYPLMIVDGPVQDGVGYVYTVRIQTDNPAISYPTAYLQIGSEISKGWTTTSSEYNFEYGGSQYPGVFKLQSQLSTFGQEYKVTDKAMREQGRLGVEFQYENMEGKKTSVSRFMPMVEAKLYDELYKSIEAQLTYGTKSTIAETANKYVKRTGPGLRQQLSDGWVEYYSGSLTTKRLQDYLMSIYHTRVNESNRDTVAMTGSMGKFLFHQMLQGEARTFFTVDTNYIQKVANPSGSSTQGLKYGAEFVEYAGPLGVNVKLTHNPNYDSRNFCRIAHPTNPIYTIDSMRMTFMDFTKTGGESNIQMLKLKDYYKDFIVLGSHGPNGPITGGGTVSVAIAGYSKHVDDSAGIVVFDASRCGELIFDTEY
jgi:hypothetical protein